MMENGVELTEKEKELKFGLMELDTRVILETIEPMEEVNFGIRMVIYTMEIGLMIKLTVKEYIATQMVLNMMVIGSMTCRMDTAWRHGNEYNEQEGWMVQNMKGII